MHVENVTHGMLKVNFIKLVDWFPHKDKTKMSDMEYTRHSKTNKAKIQMGDNSA